MRGGTMSESDAEFLVLLDRARQGDREALAELARQYEPEGRVMARGLLGPALRPYLGSIDLMQSIHRSLLLGLRERRFDVSGPEHLVALALTMTRRKVARQWRRLRRQQRVEIGPADSGQIAQVLTCLEGRETNPARASELNELRER